MSAFVEETGGCTSRCSLATELEPSKAFKEACLLAWLSGCATAQLLTRWEKNESFLEGIMREERAFAREDTLHHGSMSTPRADASLEYLSTIFFIG